jgi:hypothetical protein
LAIDLFINRLYITLIARLKQGNKMTTQLANLNETLATLVKEQGMATVLAGLTLLLKEEENELCEMGNPEDDATADKVEELRYKLQGVAIEYSKL